MDIAERLKSVLDVARGTAAAVDTDGTFPAASVDELRNSGLFGLTVPADAGGLGGGPSDLVDVLVQLAGVCGSTAMIYLMHVSSTMTIAAALPPGRPDLLRQLATGKKLSTFALSEPGSRSHFWAPVSRGRTVEGGTQVTARKSFSTSAGHADIYVVSTLTSPELVPATPPPVPVDLFVIDGGATGVEVTGQFSGLGLRGNASSPMMFDLSVPDGDRLGAPATGFELMISSVMPWFNLGNAAVSVGVAQAAVSAAISHTAGARFEHLGESLAAALPTIRAQLARMALDLSTTRSYVDLTAASIAAPDEATSLHVLGVKAHANDMALRVTESALRVCGGAAFSKHLPIERHFRDARAGSVMGPTADVLYDFYGKAITGLPLF